MIWDPRAMHSVSAVQSQSLAAKATRDMLLIGYNYALELQRPAN